MNVNTIHVLPYWDSNPYQNLLYLEARSDGWEVNALFSLEQLQHLAHSVHPGDILHVHWTTTLTDGATTHEQFLRRVREIDAALQTLQQRGGRVFWTVHNLVSHDSDFPEAEFALARTLNERANTIYVLNRATAEAAAPYYNLTPAKIRLLPHGSYQGIYPSPPAREEARLQVRLANDSAAIGMVGMLRGYKGIRDLIAAGDILNQRAAIEILLAGKADGNTAAMLVELRKDRPYLHTRTDFLTDTELVANVAALDVVVLPYMRVLNSGSVLLAASLHRRTVLPGTPHLRTEFGDQPWITFFDAGAAGPSRPFAIADAVDRSLQLDEQLVEQSSDSFSRSYTLVDMSREFARDLR